MVIKSDIPLKGTAWKQAIDAFGMFFERANYSLYLLSASIGIMYDKRIDKLPIETMPTNEENEFNIKQESSTSVPRNVIHNHDGGKLSNLFQTAILATTTENFTEDERLQLAFGDEGDGDEQESEREGGEEFNKVAFLTEFANFGVVKLVENIGKSPIESMENLKNFFLSSVQGTNIEIDDLPDDILLEE